MEFELFLNKISNISKKYEEIHRISGEAFNIFNILNVDDDEHCHSSFIYELLNPNGSHYKGNLFLKLFLEEVKLEDFPIKNVTVKKEKFIGYIKNNTGGRIDIVISNNLNMYQQIFIENKIYAKDQNDQLLHYYNYNKKAHLFYLTLTGKNADESNMGKNSEIKYTKLSYEYNILNWLEKCKEASMNNPILKETITQYILLIKQLTNQTRSKEMKNEYLDIILRDSGNVSAAFEIANNIQDIEYRILKDKFIPSLELLAKKLGLKLVASPEWCFDQFWGFSFKKEEWKDLIINFEFESGKLRNLIYGFKGKNIPKELNKYLRGLKYQSSEDWPLFQYMDVYRNWNQKFFVEICIPENDIIKVIEEKIKELLSLIDEAQFNL
jgi:hypothetical protein